MNQQQKLEYWQTFNNFQQSREKKYAPAISRILTEQKKEFIQQFKEQGYITKLNALPLRRLITDLYFDAAITFGAKVLTAIKRASVEQKSLEVKRRMPIGFNARMQFLIEQYFGLDFLNMSEDITQTTKDILTKVLIQAQADGLGFDDIVRQLESTELSKKRARLIARTETVSAANSGAMLSAKESGIMVQKIWIATRDARTRHDHRMVETGAIGIDEYFNVGGYQMAQPGDRGGKDGRLKVPAKEICNCRCTVAFQPVRDSAGRTISLN